MLALALCQAPSRPPHLVSSARPDELRKWWCCGGTAFPMILVLYRSDPALPELEQKLTQGSRVCKMFQKPWNCPTCSWRSEDATDHLLLTAVYLLELGTMTRASLVYFLQACMNFSWTWSILDEALFKIPQVKFKISTVASRALSSC